MGPLQNIYNTALITLGVVDYGSLMGMLLQKSRSPHLQCNLTWPWQNIHIAAYTTLGLVAYGNLANLMGMVLQ